MSRSLEKSPLRIIEKRITPGRFHLFLCSLSYYHRCFWFLNPCSCFDEGDYSLYWQMMYCSKDFQILCHCNIWSKIISGPESAYNKVVTIVIVSPISPVSKQRNHIFHLDHAKLLSVYMCKTFFAESCSKCRQITFLNKKGLSKNLLYIYMYFLKNKRDNLIRL